VRFGPLLLAGLVAVGCSNYTSSIKADAPLHAGSAYLYGRFFITSDTQGAAIGGTGMSMGLEIRCEDGATYTFGANDTRNVQVLEIAPSRCWLARAVFDSNNGMSRSSRRADPSTQRPLDFTAGRAHYIGDYFAKATRTVILGLLASKSRLEWSMNPAAGDQYQATTAEMQRAFPSLASLPTDDLRLISKAEHKGGNGIGPSPGEPPLSPVRVARLAPFIRRSYATPAQCEAACPSGRCLPYRSESGPAMACVIRCDRNADCPTGLGCNCPNNESPAGPDCHPIATTDNDPMDRMCLAIELPGDVH
jgi:hypothetical protein